NGTEVTGDITLQTDLGRGGSGGGAGGAYTPVDGREGTGGGGGAGGGTIVIHAARDITLNTDKSFIVAYGGNGGSAGDGTAWGGGTGLGGAGGAGAGGTIWLAAGNQISDLVWDGINRDSGIFADRGFGGSPLIANRRGADGSFGRVWSTDSDCDGPTAPNTGCSLSAYPWTDAVKFGQTRYKQALFEFYTKPIDLNNTKPTLDSLVVAVASPGSGTVTAKVQASDDASFASPTAEVDASQISSVSGHRYLRLHLTLSNTNAITPIKVTGITINFSPQNTSKYEFISACGNIGTSWLLILFAMFLIMVPSHAMRFRLKS
ncbi:MAG: hypothetical protein SGJ18_13885, partial [Pseudomonadota bacterium]|nr:hypothetical protein [Pseudomonadota bacterium]